MKVVSAPSRAMAPRFAGRLMQAKNGLMGFLFGKEPGYVFGMTLGGEVAGGATFKIEQARELLEQGKVRDALAFLGLIATNYIEAGETSNALSCLRESARIFRGENNPQFFQFGLKIAELFIKLGKKTDADNIFSEVCRFVALDTDVHQRDVIRNTMVFTLRAGGDMPRAQMVAGWLEGKMQRFDIFMRLARWLAQEGQLPRAKGLLLRECLELAKEPDRFHFPERHIAIAKTLIGINCLPEARELFEHAHEFILSRGWEKVDNHGQKQLEQIGLGLILIGEKDLAVRLLTEGLIKEEGTSPQEKAVLQDKIIEQRWPSIVRSFIEGEKKDGQK